MKKDLTDRQKEILGFLKDFIADFGYPPTLREICRSFGINGPKNARKHLDALEKKGFIKRRANISRAIEVEGCPAKNAVSIPVVGRVRAGVPNLAVEDVLGHVTLDSRFFKCKDAFLLKVEGDSMRGAGIEEGDYVIVRPQKEALNNDIVVASIGDKTTVKRFFRKGQTIILKPENPGYPPIEIKNPGDAGREVTIIGKVISIIKPVER